MQETLSQATGTDSIDLFEAARTTTICIPPSRQGAQDRCSLAIVINHMPQLLFILQRLAGPKRHTIE